MCLSYHVKSIVVSKNAGLISRQEFFCLVCACFVCLNLSVFGVSSSFSFRLDEPFTTSAGVFALDGTLVRTLWSKVGYSAGTNSAVWDGLDDYGNPVPSGQYQIKLLQHNTEYVWDGAIGNTSAEPSGPTVHRGFYPIRDMAISGTNGFYVSGYNEGMYAFRNFLTTDPQRVRMSWYWVYSAQFNRVNNSAGDIYDLNWMWVAADSAKVYFACSATPDPANTIVPNVYPGCIVACNVGNNSPAYFTNGVQILNYGGNSPLPSGIYVGTKPGLSGLAVQQNGNLLAASVGPDNRVYLFNKNTGSASGSFAVDSPGRLSFAPDGTLWVISGTQVFHYTNLDATPTATQSISNLSKPFDVAASPLDSNLILVADGGSSQQVRAFQGGGSPVWTYGLPGGYQTNGATVSTDKFWFYNGEADGTFLCFAPDGSFWVGDGGNNRALHFSAARVYIEQIMYQPHSYITAVDQTDPTRVFNQFAEFKVDYSKPLSQGWTLVKNWKVNVDPPHISWNEGLIEVTTFTNGRTYALIETNTGYGRPLKEICELGTNQLRFTGIYPMATNEGRWVSLGPDGSARATTIGFARWYEADLKGFDTNNNPVWNAEKLIASAPEGASDPVPRCCSFGNVRETISSNNILISFDQSLNSGWHLGGIRVGSTNWLWKASPTIQWMNGLGTYEVGNGLTYAGNTPHAVDRNVIYGYHGEFFRSQGQACQHMHFYDDGLFVGQFGEATPGHSAYEGALPASASNAHSPSLVKTAEGEYYLWVNDEGSHGPQRWHFVNARNIREQVGAGTLGNAITLTNQASDFPSAVTARAANQSVDISWNAVPGVASYVVRYATNNGGPYLGVLDTTTNLTSHLAGLTNGTTYYFIVSSVQNGVEKTPSAQVAATPFDPSARVLAAGSMAEGGQFTPILAVNSNAPAKGEASLLGSEQYTGLISPRDLNDYGYGNLQNTIIGTKGYLIFDWGGYGAHATNISGPFSVTLGAGWTELSYLERKYRLGSTVGENDGLVGTPSGSITITVTDSAAHYLTVVSPAQFNNARHFTMRLTSTNNSSASFRTDEEYGFSHIYQFLFTGDVTLTADGTDGTGAIVQALFFDNVSARPRLGPPTQLRIQDVAP